MGAGPTQNGNAAGTDCTPGDVQVFSYAADLWAFAHGSSAAGDDHGSLIMSSDRCLRPCLS